MKPVPKAVWLVLALSFSFVWAAMGALVVERGKLRHRTTVFTSRLATLQGAVEALQVERSKLTSEFESLASSASQLRRGVEEGRLEQPEPNSVQKTGVGGTGGRSALDSTADEIGFGGQVGSAGSWGGGMGGEGVKGSLGEIGGYGGMDGVTPICGPPEYGDDSGTGALEPGEFCRLYLFLCALPGNVTASKEECAASYVASGQQRCRTHELCRYLTPEAWADPSSRARECEYAVGIGKCN